MCGSTCSMHEACAFVFICAAGLYHIACSLCVSVRMPVFYMDAAATYETHAFKNAVRAAKRQKLPHGE